MSERKDWMSKENTGFWTVLGPYIVTPKGEKKYLCRCDCGTERYVLERTLRHGESKSCGCFKVQKIIEAIELKLDGRTFENLKVLRKSDKKRNYGGTWWMCECSCGKIVEIPGTLLVTGRRTHCGCKPNYHYVDITDQAFNFLTAKYITERKNGVVTWHCVCECGNEVDVPYNELVYSHRKSCGCKKEAHEQNLSRFLTHVGGTSVDIIRSRKLPSDNTTGVKGVYLINGKYLAKIVFQKKAYYLGTYENIEEAAQARKDAEEILFGGMTSFYEKWKIKADNDPKWAQENPIEVSVDRNASGRLVLIYSPTGI